LGLLEAIPDDAILAVAAAQTAADNGIAGQPNQVWDDVQQKTVLGRFGWKAGQPTLNQQNVHAFSADMGLTTTLRPFDECTPAQTACKAAPDG
ncbi:di-heme oxidoredictase family protein, partial [Pseudomonas viridiflava]|uniref:di-heme oxidoredictase family protein n=1 Tax=Pseudomonas viridiflava TaxID=33069 RepID=UPI002404981C